ncbi:MAG: hypothetical protein Q7R39_11510, partial [Dehalococcoidia bacterium]|nr:hypothetical protein [Dehalococcoidia bacterium]
MSCSICGEAQGALKTFRDVAGAFIRTLCQTCIHRRNNPNYNEDTHDPVTGLRLEHDTNQPDPAEVTSLKLHPQMLCGVCEPVDYQVWAAAHPNPQWASKSILRCVYCAEDSRRGQYEEPIDAAMAAGLGGIPAEVLAASMVLGPGEVRADIPMEQTDPDFL